MRLVALTQNNKPIIDIPAFEPESIAIGVIGPIDSGSWARTTVGRRTVKILIRKNSFLHEYTKLIGFIGAINCCLGVSQGAIKADRLGLAHTSFESA